MEKLNISTRILLLLLLTLIPTVLSSEEPLLSLDNFVFVKAGTFDMGSPLNELYRQVDESAHEVTLTKDFYIYTTEVTQALWKTIMMDNSSDTAINWNDDYPWRKCR